MKRPSILAWLLCGLACLAGQPTSSAADESRGLTGEYGFLSCSTMGPQPEEEIRRRVAVMAQEYGVREFQFYDWFADYSTPTLGPEWTDPFLHQKAISRRTIEISIDEVHRQGGRAWAYVQAVAAEKDQIADPRKGLRKLRDAKGNWLWYPPVTDHPRFPTFFANAAWARVMVQRWADPVKELGFDGIHWDTLGHLAGDLDAETAGMHAFIATAKPLLQAKGLRQTINMVDLAWWDRRVVRDEVEFPYAEVWSPEIEKRYYAEMDQPDMAGHRGVMAMYSSTAVPTGWDGTQVVCARHNEARKHRLVYIAVGDGARRMKGEYWPDTTPLNPQEASCLRDGIASIR